MINNGNSVEWMEEENYMFKLSEFSEQLLQWLDEDVVYPPVFNNLARSFIKEGLPDLSVSREASRLQWGISVPGDPSQTIYVWLDALINYLTVCGYPDCNTFSEWWPANCQIIGKDILRFHAIYWPAFLMAANLKPPRSILCHSHWLVDEKKMSKSKGNVVDPDAFCKKVTVDGMRYYLLRDGVPHSDGNFSEDRLIELLNTELSNTLGNLLNRISSKAVNPQQTIPLLDMEVFNKFADEEDQHMLQMLKGLAKTVDQHFESYSIYKALDVIMIQLRSTNTFLQRHKVWELVKQKENEQWYKAVLAMSFETLRVCGILLQPSIPEISNKLLTKISVADHKRDWNSLLPDEKNAERVLDKNKVLLFKKI